MSTVDVKTLKARAEELFARAVSGEGTVIEQDGRRAVLLPCEGEAPDLAVNPELDRLLRERLQTPGRKPTPEDWQALRTGLPRR